MSQLIPSASFMPSTVELWLLSCMSFHRGGFAAGTIDDSVPLTCQETTAMPMNQVAISKKDF